MIYVLPTLGEVHKDLPSVITKLIQEFPAHNSHQPVKHCRFEDITSLFKQEKKVWKSTDISFDNTEFITLTETWKLMSALFQLLFAVITGKIFPSDLTWGKKHGILGVSFNMERCFVNALVSCVEVFWYANAQELTEKQVHL